MNFKNKVVWLTGGSSGIGEALTYELLRQGATVIASSEDYNGLVRVQNNCDQNSRPRCHIVLFDLTEMDAIDTLVSDQIKQFGRIDILINISGISQRSLVKETPMEVYRKIMEINYFGTIAFTKAVLPYMIAQGGGHILATTSIAGKFGFSLRSAYSSSKHALHGFFETLRIETMKENIRVTLLVPGRVQTNISVHALTKDGTQHGKMDAGQATGITAEKAARQILRAIRKNRKEALIGGKERIMVYLKKFLPSIFYKIASKIDPT